MADNVSGWLSAVEGLADAHARLLRVEVENVPALELPTSEEQDAGEWMLYYLDTPYLAQTRTSPKVYGREMSEADHRAFLAFIRGSRARVMLSGYASTLYDRELAGWMHSMGRGRSPSARTGRLVPR
jgi:DNA adenine methylase